MSTRDTVELIAREGFGSIEVQPGECRECSNQCSTDEPDGK